MAVPRPLGAAGGADVEVIADADDPHRGVGPQLAVLAADCEFQFDCVSDPAQLLVSPPAGAADTYPTRGVHDREATNGLGSEGDPVGTCDSNDSSGHLMRHSALVIGRFRV